MASIMRNTCASRCAYCGNEVDGPVHLCGWTPFPFRHDGSRNTETVCLDVCDDCVDKLAYSARRSR